MIPPWDKVGLDRTGQQSKQHGVGWVLLLLLLLGGTERAETIHVPTGSSLEGLR
jgi:hypothetical protein